MKTERHQAIIDILIKYCGLMDMHEEDEENPPILTKVMTDERYAADYLLQYIEQSID